MREKLRYLDNFIYGATFLSFEDILEMFDAQIGQSFKWENNFSFIDF